MSLTCSVCNLPEDFSLNERGRFTRELRPYGAGGRPICFPCATSNAAREATAMRQLEKTLTAASDVAVVQAGAAPRPATTNERRQLIRRVK